MATFKVDVQKRYGKFQLRCYPSGQQAPDYAGDLADVSGVLKEVDATLDAAGRVRSDTVIFRGVGYETPGTLREAIRTAPY